MVTDVLLCVVYVHVLFWYICGGKNEHAHK